MHLADLDTKWKKALLFYLHDTLFTFFSLTFKTQMYYFLFFWGGHFLCFLGMNKNAGRKCACVLTAVLQYLLSQLSTHLPLITWVIYILMFYQYLTDYVYEGQEWSRVYPWEWWQRRQIWRIYSWNIGILYNIYCIFKNTKQ